MASESAPGVLLLMIAVEEDGAATEVVLGSGQEDKLDCVQTRGCIALCTKKRLLTRAKCHVFMTVYIK